jgi:hypothetical protein
MKEEVINGAKIISENFPEQKQHYEELIKYVNNY